MCWKEKGEREVVTEKEGMVNKDLMRVCGDTEADGGVVEIFLQHTLFSGSRLWRFIIALNGFNSTD